MLNAAIEMLHILHAYNQAMLQCCDASSQRCAVACDVALLVRALAAPHAHARVRLRLTRTMHTKRARARAHNHTHRCTLARLHAHAPPTASAEAIGAQAVERLVGLRSSAGAVAVSVVCANARPAVAVSEPPQNGVDLAHFAEARPGMRRRMPAAARRAPFGAACALHAVALRGASVALNPQKFVTHVATAARPVGGLARGTAGRRRGWWMRTVCSS
jgi:hypothetical protein